LRLAYDDFLLSREAMRCTPKTLEHYHYTARVFVEWLEARGIVKPDEVKASHVRAYLAEARRRGLKDTAIHAHARGVKTFLRFLHAERYIPEPIAVQMPRLDKRILPAFSPDARRRGALPSPYLQAHLRLAVFARGDERLHLLQQKFAGHATPDLLDTSLSDRSHGEEYPIVPQSTKINDPYAMGASTRGATSDGFRVLRIADQRLAQP
jgi:hypothetical protein